jgi:predicted nuclease of predicted toxin-antitoxin system
VRFLLDHDVPGEVAHVLRHWGYAVAVLREVLPITTPDDEVFGYARRERLTRISCNRAHFLALAEGAIHAQTEFAGLIILIRRRSRQAECAHLLRLLRQAGDSGLSGNINFA